MPTLSSWFVLIVVPTLTAALLLLFTASHERACDLLLVDHAQITQMLLASFSVQDRVLALGGGNISDAVLRTYRAVFRETRVVVFGDLLYAGTAARAQQFDRIVFLGRDLYDPLLATEFANSFMAVSSTRLLRDGGTVSVVGVMGPAELQQWLNSLCGAQGMYLLSTVSVPPPGVPSYAAEIFHVALHTARAALAAASGGNISACTDEHAQFAHGTLQLRVLTFRKQGGIHTPAACLTQARMLQ